MIRTNRKSLTFGTMVVAGIMVLASTAFACTTFKGTMVVTGNSVTAGTSTAVGKSDSGMKHCKVTPGANATNTAGSVTISSSTTNLSGCPVSNLDGTTLYEVNFVGGKAFGKFPNGPLGTYQWLIDCMSPPGSGVTNIGSVTTASNGDVAATSFNLPSGLTNNNSGEDSAVCLSTPNGGNGNQAPVHIVSL